MVKYKKNQKLECVICKKKVKVTDPAIEVDKEGILECCGTEMRKITN